MNVAIRRCAWAARASTFCAASAGMGYSMRASCGLALFVPAGGVLGPARLKTQREGPRGGGALGRKPTRWTGAVLAAAAVPGIMHGPCGAPAPRARHPRAALPERKLALGGSDATPWHL